MVITYHGLTCFKIQSGDTTLVFDLPSKKSSAKIPRFHADIIVQSLPSQAGQSYDGEVPANSFLIDGPGEYEIKGVYIHGLKSYHDSVSGKKHGLNTVYSLRFENINLCFLGNFGEKELRPELKEEIGKVDILFIPIGGDTVLDAEEARNIVNQIEPVIAIPMHYSFSGRRDALKDFLHEMGQKDVKAIEKLSIKKKDIAENGTHVVVLSPL
jgi:L-ascorbate metabolism protein UlaG (beta-lactamase superfamily)